MRRWLWLTAALAVAIGAAAVAASWHFSSRVLIPDRSQWSEEVEIVAVGRDRIVFERSEVSLRPGLYGLTWDGGHAVVGAAIATDGETVTRRLGKVHGYLVPGAEAGLEGYVFAGDPGQDLGLPFRSVGVPGELGPMPACRRC